MLNNFKICCQTKSDAVGIQEILFDMGYYWHISGLKIKLKVPLYIIGYANKFTLKTASTHKYFDEHENKNIKPSDLYLQKILEIM